MNVYLKFTLFSFFSSILFMVFAYLLIYSWLSGGLTTMEMAFVGIVVGLIFLAVFSIGETIFLVSYKNDCIRLNEKPLSNIKQLFLLTFLTIGIVFILDYIYYYFFDSNVTQVYVDSMEKMLLNSGQTEETVAELSKLPFMVINFAVIILTGIISAVISLLVSNAIMKRNEEILL